jgi:transposase
MNNPALCIDVSKSSSYASAFLTYNNPFSKPMYFEHTPQGILCALKLLKELENVSDKKPDVVLEATGNYSKSIVQYFQGIGYQVIVLNPLQTSMQKRKNMRKVKTDPIDTHRIAQVYYMNDFLPYAPLSQVLGEIQNLSRQWHAINTQYSETQLRYRCVIDLIFPKFQNVFYEIACPTALSLLSNYPTPKDILSGEKGDIISILRLSRQSLGWCENKYNLLITAASESLSYDAGQQSNIIILRNYIILLRTYQSILVDIRDQIKKWSKLSPELSLLLSIDGVGDITAATILGEIGDISRFISAKKLTAFAGLDPSVYQSGNFRAKNNKISKRGSTYLRKALYQATVAGISNRKSGIVNSTLHGYYSQKLSEGKSKKSAIVATSHKLLRIIYGVLTNGLAYESDFLG